MSGQHSSPSKYDEQARDYEDVLKQLFSGHLTPGTSAPKLASIAVPNPNIDPEDCEGDLQSFWQDVLAAMVEIPGRVPLVANLIFCMSQLPSPITSSGKPLAVNEGGERVWEDTPTLGWILRDEWNCECTSSAQVVPLKEIFDKTPVDLLHSTDQATRQMGVGRFVAMNVLIALLMVHDQDRFDYRSFTLYAFKSALEYSESVPEAEDDEQHPDYQKGHILAAAKLVEIAGSIIHEWDFEFESGPLIGDKGSGGALWDGKHGFCKGRWELWKRRFFEISDEGSFGDEVGDCARKAGEAMAEIDGRAGY
jgi:hypothetical protein